MEDQMAVMFERLKVLEEKIYNKDSTDINDKLKVDETLQAISNKISIALIGREKVASLFKRLDEIEKYLDPSLGEEMTMNDAAKLNIIISQEPVIKLRAEQLEKVEELEPVLSSEHIKATPSLNGKLQSLNHVQLQQNESSTKVSEEIWQLASSYNSIISLLTQQFIQWEEMITKAELACAASSKRKS